MQTLPTLWCLFSKPRRCDRTRTVAVFFSLHRTTTRIKFRARLGFLSVSRIILIFSWECQMPTDCNRFLFMSWRIWRLFVVKSDNVKSYTRPQFLGARELVLKWQLSFKTYRFTAGFDPIFQDLLLKMKSREHNEVLVDSLYGAILSGLCWWGSRNCSAIYRIHSQHPIQTAPLNVRLLIRSLFCQQETVLNCQFSYIPALQKRHCRQLTWETDMAL